MEADGRQFKKFYGMSSTTAMEKHSGGVANYRSSEGKAVVIPYRGPVEATIFDLLGGMFEYSLFLAIYACTPY